MPRWPPSRQPGLAFAYPESAARALGRAAERAEWLRRPLGTELDVDGRRPSGRRARSSPRRSPSADDVWLDPEEARRLLGAYGVRLVAERSRAEPDEAAAAAAELGFPVVVKTAEAGAHKTETGGVALDLADEEAVRAAAARIGGPVVVQPMVEGGVELLAGHRPGSGLRAARRLRPGRRARRADRRGPFRLAPLTDIDAAGARPRRQGRAARARASAARPAADAAALVDLLGRLSRLGEDLPEVAELDLNPVLALPEGYVVVDARVRVRPPAAARRRRRPGRPPK